MPRKSIFSIFLIMMLLTLCMVQTAIAETDSDSHDTIPAEEQIQETIPENENDTQETDSANENETQESETKASGNSNTEKQNSKLSRKLMKNNTGIEDENTTIDIDVKIMTTESVYHIFGATIIEDCVLHLYANGKEVDTRVFNASEHGHDEVIRQFVFEDQPKYDDEGQYINYSIKITCPDGVTAHCHQGEKTGSVYYYSAGISYSNVDVTVRFGYKNEQEEYNDFPVTLLRNGKPYQTKLVRHNSYGGAETVEFGSLPLFDEDGATYTYSLDEEKLREYIPEFENKTNPWHPYEIRYLLGQSAEDQNPDDIKLTVYLRQYATVASNFTYRIYADGELVEEVHITERPGNTSKYHDLPKQRDGQDINYTVTVESHEENIVGTSTQEGKYVWLIEFRGNTAIKHEVQVEAIFEEEPPTYTNSITGSLYSNTTGNIASFSLGRNQNWNQTLTIQKYDRYGEVIQFRPQSISPYSISGFALYRGTMREEDGVYKITLYYSRPKSISFIVVPDESLTNRDIEELSEVYFTISSYGKDGSNISTSTKMNNPGSFNNLAKLTDLGEPTEWSMYCRISSSAPYSIQDKYSIETSGNDTEGYTFTVKKEHEVIPELRAYFNIDEAYSADEEIVFEMYHNDLPTGVRKSVSAATGWACSFELPDNANADEYTARLVNPPQDCDIENYDYYNQFQNIKHCYYYARVHEYTYSDIPFDIQTNNPSIVGEFDNVPIIVSINGVTNEYYYEDLLIGSGGGTITGLCTAIDGEPLHLSATVMESNWNRTTNPRLKLTIEYDPHFNDEGPGFHVYYDYINEDKYVYDLKKIWEAYAGLIYFDGGKWAPRDPAGLFMPGEQPGPITIKIYRDGEYYDIITMSYEDNNWRAKLALERYRSDGSEYVYTFKEDEVSGYEGTVSIHKNPMVDGAYLATFYNAPDKVKFSVKKLWDELTGQSNLRPKSILATVYANGRATIFSKLLSEENGWQTIFEDLPAYYAVNEGYELDLQNITYTIMENIVDYYRVKVTGNRDEGFTLTNKNVGVTTIKGKKTWDDDSNAAGSRPTSITVNLLADGEIIEKKTITAADNWEYEFKDLYTMRYGKKIEYSISEEPVEGYKTIIDGYDLKNIFNESEKTNNTDNEAKTGVDKEEGKPVVAAEEDNTTVRLNASPNTGDETSLLGLVIIVICATLSILIILKYRKRF